jgi:hypothetical protein
MWTLQHIAETTLNATERKVLRKIYGPGLAKGQWRKRYMNEIYNLYKEMELIRNIIEKTPMGGPHVENEGRKGA